jgi:hypothetical protein
MLYKTERATSSAISAKFRVSSVIAIAIANSETVMGRLGEIPDQSESADSFQGSGTGWNGTGWNGTFQSFLSELIPVDSQYLVKTSINYAIKRLKTIV